VFPDHWSLLFGQIAFYSFVVITLSGVVLTFQYEPSTEPVVYDGPYGPLQGTEMSRALDSTLAITFETRGGLLVRQIHHWSTLIMVAAITLHLLRLFFSGRYRRPRRLNWLVVFSLLIVTLGACLTGTSLPDDMASGTSLAVLDGVLQATPFVGSAISYLLFGGEFPGNVLTWFYPLHIVVLPLVIVGLFVAVAVLAIKHSPIESKRKSPVAIVKGAGLFCFVVGVSVLMAATATINPVWLYGPADPTDTSAGVGPAWYLAFLDGSLRLAPGWEVVWWGKTISLAVLLPVAACTLFLVIVALYPFLEERLIGVPKDQSERPRDNPISRSSRNG
jgi:ubiquinol-cytochrome c reductase cytochrome b subunit